MSNSTTWIGMDVHKERIHVVAVNEAGHTEARWETPNTAKGKGRLATRLAGLGKARCVYEAGPCGYELRRFLDGKGIPCDVTAPSLIPTRAGDRVKTDRRTAEKLARKDRMGELTAIHVPTPAQEALRDLVRAREDANEGLVRARHRLQRFLLRQGRRFEGKSWTRDHGRWIRALSFDDNNAETVLAESLLAVDQQRERVARGVGTLTAMTLLSELIDFTRFASPRELMSFIGLVPSEYSSGGIQRRGSLTWAVNAHMRRVLVEAAWHYRHPPHRTGETIRKRREGQSPEEIETARKAEVRLHRNFTRMVMRGKRTTVAAVAVARELAGFVWAIVPNPRF